MKRIILLLALVFCTGIYSQQRFAGGSLDGPMTTTEINALVSPTEGLEIYNSTTQTKWRYNGSSWDDLGSGGSADIDTFAELNAIVADKSLVNLEDAQTFSNVITFDDRVEQSGLGGSTYFGLNSGQTDDLSGNNNTGFGADALRDVIGATLGNQNSAFGKSALLTATEGTSNNAFGYLALSSLTTGGNNSVYGVDAMRLLTTGSGNIAIGNSAGEYAADGTTANQSTINSIYLGYNTESSAANQDNEIAIGYNVEGNGSNTVTIGNPSITDNFFSGDMDITGQYLVNGTPISTGGSGHTIQDEGVAETARANLNFVGPNVDVTDDLGNDATVVTINDTPGDNTVTSLKINDGTIGEPDLEISNSPTADDFLVYDLATQGFKWVDDTTVGSSLPVSDATSIVEGSVDATKELRFEVDGLTTATTRVITMKDEDIDLNNMVESKTAGLPNAEQILTIVAGNEADISGWAADPNRLDVCKDCKTVYVWEVPITGQGDDIAVATSVNSFFTTRAVTVTNVYASLSTAPTGSVATFDINESGTSILSTKITIDATENTSNTAATAPVISDSAIAAFNELTFDIDGVGSTVAGATGTIYIHYTVD